MSNNQLFSGGEKSWQKLNVKGIDVNDTRVFLEFPAAESVVEEYTQIDFTIDNITNVGGGVPWTTSSAIVSGDDEYVGIFAGVGPAATFEFVDEGIYSISMKILDVVPSLQANDSIRFTFEDSGNPQDCDISGMLTLRGIVVGATRCETISRLFRPITGDQYKVRGKILNRAGPTTSFSGCLIIVRIK